MGLQENVCNVIYFYFISKQLTKKENDEKRQKELHQILTDFANNSSETTKAFSPSLNSFERMLVHEVQLFDLFVFVAIKH